MAILAQSSSPNGGAGSHVAAAAEALTAAGDRVLVRSGVGSGDLPAATVEEVERTIAAADPDVVHVHDVWEPTLLERLVRRWPTVLDVHNHVSCASGHRYLRPGDECRRVHGRGCLPTLLSGRCSHRRDPRPAIDEFRRTTARLASLRSAAAVVCHSEYVADDLRRAGIDARVVPYFVPLADTTPRPPGRRILFAGRVVATKGLDVLLAALARLPGAELDVHGDGWWLDAGRGLAARLGVGDRVRFHGWASPADLARAHATADVVCVPSVWPEPFGIVGIEAMAAGLPVVASDGGGVPEWLVPGETGLLVPPGDPEALAAALAAVLDDPEVGAAYGIAGRARVAARFSASRFLEAVGAVYDEVAGG